MIKTSALLFTIVLTAGLTYGQNCKYKKNETDEFTKEKTKMTEASLMTAPLMGGASSKIDFISKNDNFTFWVYYSNTTLAEKISVQQTDTLMIKLDNDSIVKLAPQASVDMIVQSINGVIVKYITPTYLITKGQIEQLSKHKILKVRFYFNGKKLEHDIKSKNAEQVMTSATCILL